MDKNILQQYVDMKSELGDLEERIRSMEEKLEEITSPGYTVKDSVVCGKKGRKPLGSKKVEGHPDPEIAKRKTQLYQRKLNYEKLKANIEEKMTEVEKYIAAVPYSNVRQMLRLYYLNGLTWSQVARKMNERNRNNRRVYTEDYCRITCERKIKNKNF